MSNRDLASWTHFWFAAATRQERRIYDAEDHTAAPVEFLLFVDAMRNVYRGASAVLGRTHEAVLAFEEASPDLKDLRDMFEHFDAYAKGQGKLQKARLVEPSDADAVTGPVRLVWSGGNRQHKVGLMVTNYGVEARREVESTTAIVAAASLVAEVMCAAGIKEVSALVEEVLAR